MFSVELIEFFEFWKIEILKKNLKKHFELLFAQMPRRYYKPYKRNYSSNKKKWASFMKDIPSTNVTIPGQSTGGAVATIVSNSSDTAVPTPTIIKVKHIRVAFDFTSAQYYFNGGFLCILFVPQGITPDAGTPLLHPEWVMAWKGIELDAQTPAGKQVMISTSLSRNLNSGDSIVMLWSARNTTAGEIGVTYYARTSCVVRNN